MTHPCPNRRLPGILSTSIAFRLTTVVAIGTVLTLAGVNAAKAFTIVESANAPTTNILASQLTDATGPQINSQDFTDNGGPPGQTFGIDGSGSFRLDAFTIRGRGDSGGGSSGANWSIQIGSVDIMTGQITALSSDTSTVIYTANNDFLTFNLTTPVVLNAGTLYAFSVFSGNGWYGLAHSAGDVYSGGTAFNNDLNTTQGGNQAPARTFNGFVSARNYDFIFAAQGIALASTKTWSGQVNGNWNTTTANFTGQTFANNDSNIVFGDLDGAGSPPVTRNITIQPGGVTPGAIMTVSNSTGDYTFTGSINGAVNNTVLTKTGTSSLALSGSTDNNGLGVSVAGGTLLLDKASSATVHAVANTIIGSGGTVLITGTGGDQIANTATVTAVGTLDLNGANEAFDALAGNGIVTNNSSDAPSTLTLGSANGGATFSGAINDGFGIVSLVKVGSGNATLSGYSTFSGDVTVQAGTLTAAGGFSNGFNTILGLGLGTRTITVESGATLQWAANNILVGAGGNAANLPAIVVNGGTFSSGRFNVVGNLTLNGGTLTQSSTDNGNYQGFQFIGDVAVGGNSASTISSGNGKLNHLRGGADTTFNVSDATNNSSPDLVISTGLADGSGDYVGAGSLRKAGPGTLALTANSTYTGTTNVDEGTLLVTGSISASSVSVAAFATLGGGGFVGAVTVLDDARLSPGDGVGTLTTSSVILSNASVLQFELAQAGVMGSNDLIQVIGDLALDGILHVTELPGFGSGSFQLFSYTGNLENNDLELDSAFLLAHPQASIDASTPGVVMLVVPEPGSGIALLGSLGLVVGLRRPRFSRPSRTR